MEDKLLYFKFRNKGFVYSEPLNNIFEASEKAQLSFESNFEEVDEVLKMELDVLLKSSDNKIPFLKEYYIFDPSYIILEDIMKSQFENINSLFILEFDGQNEIVKEFISLIKKYNYNNFKFLIKQNFKYFFEKDLISSFVENRIEYMYYSDLGTFENISKSLVVNERVFVELRLESEKDFSKFLDINIPQNFIISFKIHNEKYFGKEVLDFILNKLKDFVEKKEKNLSNYFNIVRLLKFNFGNKTEKSFNLKVPNDSFEELESCNKCWAKKICHQTQLYGIYNQSPILLQNENDKCDAIRSFTEEYIKTLLLFKEIKMKEMIPVSFVKEGFKIKLINP